MGTSFTVKATRFPEKLTKQEISKKIDNVLQKVNEQMSTYLDDSELSQINQNRSNDWIPISQEMHEVLAEALRISKFSGGLFDITVGPLVNLWGFGPEEMGTAKPDEGKIHELLNKIGYQHLIIKDEGFFVKKLVPELYLDLSAIAKGYGVDKVASLLESLGITEYMVEIGGEIRVRGKNNQNQPWHIAVEKPNQELHEIEKILAVTDTGMATSGDYRNYFEIDGVRFSHTIDPRTGYPITHKLASVTVLRPTSMEADAIATVLMVMGPEKGYQFVEENKIAAFFVIKSDNDFIDKQSTEFVKYFEEKK
jgi:thiamine biosynthesis lipoprotein